MCVCLRFVNRYSTNTFICEFSGDLVYTVQSNMHPQSILPKWFLLFSNIYAYNNNNNDGDCNSLKIAGKEN